MLKIDLQSKKFFIQDKDYVLSYLSLRSVNDPTYIDLIKNNDFGILQSNSFFLGEDEYNMDAFCSCSKIDGYDIKKANINLGINDGSYIAIGGVYGDDTICMNIQTNEIFLWLTESGEGEMVKIAESMEEFLKMVNFK